MGCDEIIIAVRHLSQKFFFTPVVDWMVNRTRAATSSDFEMLQHYVISRLFRSSLLFCVWNTTYYLLCVRVCEWNRHSRCCSRTLPAVVSIATAARTKGSRFSGTYWHNCVVRIWFCIIICETGVGQPAELAFLTHSIEAVVTFLFRTSVYSYSMLCRCTQF